MSGYHPQLDPIQTCDTCLAAIDGELVRTCATPVYSNIRADGDGTGEVG